MFQKQFSGVHQRYGRDELLWGTRRFRQTLGMVKRSLQKPSYVERKQYRAENISCFRDRYSDKFRKNKNTFIGINNRQNKLCGFFFFFFGKWLTETEPNTPSVIFIYFALKQVNKSSLWVEQKIAGLFCDLRSALRVRSEHRPEWDQPPVTHQNKQR